VKKTAIKQLIYGYLLDSTSIYTNNKETKSIISVKTPLHKDRDHSRVLYISGVALRLSKSHNQKAMEIASVITYHLSEICGNLLIIQIIPPGWIYLELTHPLLATWLQGLAAVSAEGDDEMEKQRESPIQDLTSPVEYPARLFPIQYAHARCCSLVLLGHREGLIKLREPLPDTRENFEQWKLPLGSSVSAFWRLISIEQIPWLNCDGKLCLNHPAENRLIAELVRVVDNLECPDSGGSVNWEKAALDLSQAFENFWCKCRIWGEVKISSPELAQARLGLLMATQSVLRFLLVVKLGAVAPMEL
jgi:DALR anticodon binding domain